MRKHKFKKTNSYRRKTEKTGNILFPSLLTQWIIKWNYLKYGKPIGKDCRPIITMMKKTNSSLNVRLGQMTTNLFCSSIISMIWYRKRCCKFQLRVISKVLKKKRKIINREKLKNLHFLTYFWFWELLACYSPTIRFLLTKPLLCTR